MAQHSYDDFVSKVIKDPENPGRPIFLTGFLGASSKKNHVRLYTDLSLRDYFEIPEDGILHMTKVSARESTLGGTYIWVAEDTCIVSSPRVRAFDDPVTVGCPIPSETLQCPPTPYPGCGPSTHPAECPTGFNCGTQFCPPPLTRMACTPPRTFDCPTRVGCSSANINCPTIACPTRDIFNCPTGGCSTLNCPSRTGCPSTSALCPTRRCAPGAAEAQAYPAYEYPPTLVGCPLPTVLPNVCPPTLSCPLPTQQICLPPTFNPYACPPPTVWPNC
jgi:hypothetical protein